MKRFRETRYASNARNRDRDVRAKAIETNEMWTFRWYPDTPVGFCLVAASSYEALAAHFDAREEEAENR